MPPTACARPRTPKYEAIDPPSANSETTAFITGWDSICPTVNISTPTTRPAIVPHRPMTAMPEPRDTAPSARIPRGGR
nr:hypothetical protein [Paraoerskovia sediminicola]